jgi:hypothetical protein
MRNPPCAAAPAVLCWSRRGPRAPANAGNDVNDQKARKMAQVILDIRIIAEADGEDKDAIQIGIEAALDFWVRKGLTFANTQNTGTEIRIIDATVLQYDEEIEAQENAETSR